MMIDNLEQAAEEDPRRNAEREENVLISWPPKWRPRRADGNVERIVAGR
jgi:hypothetical protein